ncbi:MAG: efflux RND transporter periplasmic adaptor subunit [Xanthomonadales bacterium]|nr:efflux RND transporter periplasmic adaptor subunit [Xanthomonadales bacterium]
MKEKSPMVVNRRIVLRSLLLLVLPLNCLAQDFGPALVKVADARMLDLSSIVLVPGTVVSRDDARLSAEVAGRLLQVAEVGTVVTAGEPVAIIEDKNLRLINQELQAEIRRAQASMEFLGNEVQRFATLAKTNLASANQLEQARSELAVAQGDLDVAKARLAQNNDQLARTRLLAPFAGVVVERLMRPGERVADGGIVVRLVDQQNLEVVARAPLDYYAFSQVGEQLSLRAGSQELMATIRTVVAVGDENTHQFELRLDLESQPFQVGQTVRVSVPSSNAREVLTVPRDALVLRPEGTTIFVIDAQQQAQQVAVTTGLGSGDRIEVSGNVKAGDQVVIRGNERLQPGQSVQVMDS